MATINTQIRCCWRSAWRTKFYSFAASRMYVSSILVLTTILISTKLLVQGEPFPAPDLSYCHSSEKCCLPTYDGKPVAKFQPNTSLPLRVRRPAHLLDDAYIAKLEKAYGLMANLPSSDPRSLLNQANLHCLYCDNGIYFPNVTWPLEIHNGWLFLPWHRMFIYFHERMLAKLLDDDTFALPYWNWDNQNETTPLPNILPLIYAKTNSTLWVAERNKCSEPDYIADLNTHGGCTDKTANVLRTENTRLVYTQLVSGATTPSLFFGMPYVLGDVGGLGPGTLEDNPHGTVHAWVGNPNATAPYVPFDDMGNFGKSARDPVFYAHHANVDRIWTVWKTIPGGVRKEPTNSDFVGAEFTFYDENGNRVIVNMSQILDFDSLRYRYENISAEWITNGVAAGEENLIAYCNPTNPSQESAMINTTPAVTNETVLYHEPITFRVPRSNVTSNGTEVLEIQGIGLNSTIQAHIEAYLFFPSADSETSIACPEFFGTFNFIPHVGQAIYNPLRMWRVALTDKLIALGKQNASHIVVTFVQVGHSIQPLNFQRAEIVYDTNVGY